MPELRIYGRLRLTVSTERCRSDRAIRLGQKGQVGLWNSNPVRSGRTADTPQDRQRCAADLHPYSVGLTPLATTIPARSGDGADAQPMVPAPFRSNYSKYENGKAIPWPDTLAKFERYAAARGKPGPDFTPPVVAPPVDPMADAIQALVGELRQWRTEDRAEIAALRRAVAGLLDGSLRPGSEAEGSQVQPVRQRTKG